MNLLGVFAMISQPSCGSNLVTLTNPGQSKCSTQQNGPDVTRHKYVDPLLPSTMRKHVPDFVAVGLSQLPL
jgi:hypothetical protein